MRAVVVLGMHRSGTSCVAGMIAAAGVASAGDPGDAIRNWDNARGHHELLDAVRLDEAVLAASGGHALAPVHGGALRWTADHAAERDRLLRAPRTLLKDPRMLLALPMWRASEVAWDAIAVVRHPLAVARSLASWRGMAMADGVALWLAHNRALAADRAAHGYPVIDFDRDAAAVAAALGDALAAYGHAVDAAALARAYEPSLVHHDDADDGDARELPGLADARALHRELTGGGARSAVRRFPRGDVAAVARLADRDVDAAVAHARAALAAIDDAAAVLVPVVGALARARAYAAARAVVGEQAARVDPGLADLLLGKLALAAGDAPAAADHLAAACAVPEPFAQARLLLPHALHRAGRVADARVALAALAATALYPHRALATLAEWSWLAGDRAAALAEMARAIAAAPPHRRGRLRTRRAEWLLAGADPASARAELALAIAEDPAYARSHHVLATIP
nr:hypothetical protein [Kofleriaceae bacterium]